MTAPFLGLILLHLDVCPSSGGHYSDTPVQWSEDNARRIAYGWDMTATNGTSGGNQKQNINLPRLGTMVQSEYDFDNGTSSMNDFPYASTGHWDHGLNTYLASYYDEPFDFYYYPEVVVRTNATGIVINSP